MLMNIEQIISEMEIKNWVPIRWFLKTMPDFVDEKLPFSTNAVLKDVM